MRRTDQHQPYEKWAEMKALHDQMNEKLQELADIHRKMGIHLLPDKA